MAERTTTASKQDLLVPADIGIIGYGIVGQAIAHGFDKASGGKDKIRFYDKYKESLPLQEVVDSSKLLFITLPTPMKADESGIDLSIIDQAVESMVPQTKGTDKIIVVKSTVVPGTTEGYERKYPGTNFAFNPEFLTEANPQKDFLEAPHTIVGANKDWTARTLALFYNQRFPQTEVFLTDPTSAETVKYMRNSFLALKVAFANQWFDLCQSLGIKYEEVKRLAALDPRIVDSHLDVTRLRGFGGKCFPKDIVAILGEFHRLNLPASLLKTAWDYNKQIRANHDWDEIPFAVEGNHHHLLSDQEPAEVKGLAVDLT